MKNSLLVIIAIECLVTLQILVFDESINMHMFDKEVVLTPKIMEPIVTIKTPVFTVEQKKSLKRYIGETKSELYSYMVKNSDLDFLYNREIYLKTTKSIALYAKKFLDVPYVWGAIGPDKFDCSGFTKKIYGQSGIKIPRHSTRQAKVGTYVEYENLERGDMVFFDTERKETGTVNHVGIYLEDGKFIHASSGNKKVVITNFNEKVFYKNRFLWGRRVIENKVFDTIPNFSIDSIKYFLILLA